MKERPIIFSEPMVRAIQEGRKFATRRPFSVPPGRTDCYVREEFCRKFSKGATLWVKEALFRSEKERTVYFDSVDTGISWRWKRNTLPAMFMPREAARIFLKITGVRIQRLQEISTDDALKEGFASRKDFLDYWDSLYTRKPALQASENPWVAAIEFKRVVTSILEITSKGNGNEPV